MKERKYRRGFSNIIESVFIGFPIRMAGTAGALGIAVAISLLTMSIAAIFYLPILLVALIPGIGITIALGLALLATPFIVFVALIVGIGTCATVLLYINGKIINKEL